MFCVRKCERNGRLKVYEDAELEALLDQDSCQTQEELARILAVTQQGMSHCLISAQFLIRNGGNLFVHLIKTTLNEACEQNAAYPTF